MAFKKPQVNWEINVGEILTILGMIATVSVLGMGQYFGFWHEINKHDKRITGNEIAVTNLARALQRREDRMSQHITELKDEMIRNNRDLKEQLFRIEAKVDKKADKDG